MTWRPVAGPSPVKKSIHIEADGDFTIRSEQNVDGILELNKHLRDESPWVMGGDMKRVASIPNSVIHQWMQEGIDLYDPEHADRVAKKLNDPDYFYLRTAPGHIGPVGDGTYR